MERAGVTKALGYNTEVKKMVNAQGYIGIKASFSS